MKFENFANRSADAIWSRGGGKNAESTGNVVTTVASADEPSPLTPIADAAGFNATFTYSNTTGLDTHITDLIGTLVRGVPVLPHGANVPGTVAWQLDTGASITPHRGVITYSFLDSAHTTGMYNHPQEGFTEGFGFSPFSEAQRVATRDSMQNWDDLIAPTFREINGSGNADITLANTTTGPAQAHAYVPYSYAEIYSEILGPRYNYLNRWDGFLGDVWTATPSVNPSNAQFLPGQYGLQTLNHEIGHSLGLSHPGTYDFGDDLDGDGEADPITYEGDAQYFQDSHQYTIMSYFDSYETGAQPIDWNVMRLVYPSTPMVDDVRVIQQKYGADMTTRTGDTTYGFNATDDVTNEALRFEDGDVATIFTIWDAAGNDTLDLSGYYTDSVIDLREGAYSSAGGWGAYDPALLEIDPALLGAEDRDALLALINENNADAGFGPRVLPENHPLGYDYYYRLYFEGQVNDYDSNFQDLLDEEGNEIFLNEGFSWLDITNTGDQYLMEQNIGIAYGAVVENAIGGHGDDQINGNQANNVFTGGAGDDTFIIARYGDDDDSVDTITDFEAGDTLDLTELGDLDASDVTYVGTTLTIDTAEGDLTVIINGTFTTDDILFG